MRLGAALLLFLAVLWPGGPSTGSDLNTAPEMSLDLFQRVARADLVVHTETHDGTLRYAVVDVLETLKGSSPAPRLRISFRDFNLQRRPGMGPITFPNHQEEILFLARMIHSARRKEKDLDLFELQGGSDGRISLPAEGSGQLLDAVRQLVSLAERDPISQIEGLSRMLDGTNVILTESALDEIDRLRAATPLYHGRLMRLLASPSPGLRLRSLRLIGTTFRMLEGSVADPIADHQGSAVLAAVLERARNDPEEAVRAAAVTAVADWPTWSDVEAEIRSIATRDPAQLVRYEAERALYRARSHSVP